MKYRLPKEFAEKWVKALRSGEYKQGSGKLYDGFGYCCLGVACAISGYTNEDIIHCPLPIDLDRKKGSRLPEILFQDPWRNKHRAKLVSMVANMNDEGKSFNEIADWIEKNVEFTN